MAYQIVNRTSAVILGVYEGETESAALDTMARDAGYADFRQSALITAYGDEGEEEFERMVEKARDDLIVTRV